MAHRRYTANGKIVPSVTTILGQFKDPGPLMHWSHKCANDVLVEAVNLLENFQQSKTGAQKYNPNNFSELRYRVKEFCNSDPLERANFRSTANKAATAGTVAHKLVDLWIKDDKIGRNRLEQITVAQIAGRERTTMTIAQAAQTSFEAFTNWTKTTNFTLELTEVPLISEVHNFGGTIDCLGWLYDREFILLDWKTSKGLYADYVLQIAAYGILWEENYDPIIDNYHLLRFDKETGDFHHVQFKELESEKRMFLNLKDCHERLKLTKKRIK